MIYLAIILMMLVAPCPSKAQETEWYISDGVAIRYSATTELSGLDSEWALSIQKSPGTERTVHYRDGRPVKTWLRSLDATGMMTREAVEENGKIVEERLFDSRQQLNLERFFSPDGSIQETRYVREGGRLVSSASFKDGIETSSRLYLYFPDGRLAGVREQAANKLMPTGIERPKSRKTTSWTSTSDGLILSIFDNAGRLTGNRIYQGAVLVSTEEWIWFNGRLSSHSTERPGDGTRVILAYDEDGRLESRTETKDKKIVAHFEFVYDQEDRLVSETREIAGKVETLEYFYNSDGSLLSETRIVAGQLVLSKTYIVPDEILEEYYDKGRLFARVLYKGGRKIQETILSDGKIVRERNF